MLFKKIMAKKNDKHLIQSIELIERKNFYNDISKISETLKSIDETLSDIRQDKLNRESR